jgi:triphosphoribosyl-dephospho-CoA synthase
MLAEVASNAHRGFLFLSGLLILASVPPGPLPETTVRGRIRALARRHFGSGPQELGTLHGHGGLRTEALAGLPSVFDVGLPLLRRELREGRTRELASFRLMAGLMETVDDTTAIRRCGEGGLARLGEDGRRIALILRRGEDPVPLLRRLNREYRTIGLTMGGVADCMAVVFALERSSAGVGLRRLHTREATV